MAAQSYIAYHSIPMLTPNLQHISRINVVGTSSSGKSTFAKALAGKLNCTYVEMDAIWWKEKWQNVSEEEFFAQLEAVLATHTWVLDGNYSKTKSIKWRNVEMVIWLDFPFQITLYRAIRRALVRLITQEELWHGNKESLGKLLSKDSIVWWTIITYKKNIAKYEALMNDERFVHIQFVRLRSQKDVDEFLRAYDS